MFFFFFFKNRDQKGRSSLVGRYQQEAGGYKEWVWEGEDG
jgi:hypothetical protein